MTAFLPPRALGASSEPEHPRLQRRPPSEAERRARWEVRAAQWRARALAEAIFGGVAASALVGASSSGALRGLLKLDVPFMDLHVHREREARFMAAVSEDPVLARVQLVYVVGPRSD